MNKVYKVYTFISDLTQPRRRLQQERHKFAYFTMKNIGFARFARAFFIFGHFADVLVLSTICLYMKTIRAKQAKVHSVYFIQRDQHGIIAKKLTQGSILM